MQLTSNSDGSITVSWVVPGFKVAGSPTSTSGYPFFSAMNISTISSSNTPLQCFAPAANATYTSLGNSSGSITAYGIIHTQYGTNTANLIKDFYMPFPTTDYLYTNPESPATGYVYGFQVLGGTMSVTIPASLLLSTHPSGAYNIADVGIYALGYVGLVETGTGTPGYWWGLFEGASNSPNAQPQPPDAPTNLVASINSSNQCVVSFTSSTAGSAPIAGYKLSWGTTGGGPYPNSINLPSNPGSQQSYTFPTNQFPFNGTIQYFICQAFDDGSAAPSYYNESVTGISYSPPSPTTVVTGGSST